MRECSAKISYDMLFVNFGVEMRHSSGGCGLKRILYLSRGGFIGGSQRQLYYVITNLDREVYEPIVVCPTRCCFRLLQRKKWPRIYYLVQLLWGHLSLTLIRLLS